MKNGGGEAYSVSFVYAFSTFARLAAAASSSSSWRKNKIFKLTVYGLTESEVAKGRVIRIRNS